MKRLTALQILMIMSLLFGLLYLYKKSTCLTNHKINKAIALELQAGDNATATTDDSSDRNEVVIQMTATNAAIGKSAVRMKLGSSAGAVSSSKPVRTKIPAKTEPA